jgi:PAS domain S-box-containing protein
MTDDSRDDSTLRMEVSALQEENERLRERVAALQRALAERDAAAAAPGGAREDVTYRALFEQLPVALTVYSAAGEVVAVNPSRRKLGAADGPSPLGAADPARAAAFERAARDREVSALPVAPLAEAGAPGDEIWVGRTYVPLPPGAGGPSRVLEVLLDATAQHRAEEALRETTALHEAVLDNSTLTAYAKDTDGRYVLANSRARAVVGLTWKELRGKTDHDILPKEIADSYMASDREVMATGATVEREDSIPLADGSHYFVTTKFPLRDAAGKLRGTCSISTDITTYRRAEEENRRLQEEVIRVQDETLRALSTPLLPIGKGVVVMPLIGHIDRGRAQRVLEALLDGIVAHGAGSVILDVTGVPVVDEEVASSLVKTALAAKLLGASVILTGVQPAMARTLVTLGADLTGVVNEGTLESGIARALRR